MAANISLLPLLQSNHDQLLDLIHHNSDWLWEVDEQGRYTFCSAMVTSLLGRSPEEVIGKTPFDFMPPAEADRVGKAFAEIAAAQQSFSGLVNRNLRSDGTIVVLETSGVPLWDAQGQFRGYRGIDRDITFLGERVLHLEAVYDLAPAALFTLDRGGRIVMANQAMAALLNVPHAKLSGLLLSDILQSEAERLMSNFALADQGEALLPQEFEHGDHCLYAIPRALHDLSGKVVGLSIGCLDITKRKEAERNLAEANQKLARYAREDYLTGLFNRRYLDEQLKREIGSAWREQEPLSVCMLDVDHFKAYNDTLSHLDGDECLRSVARIISQCVMRPGDLVSRYGGEEFVFVLPATDQDGAWLVGERVRTAIETMALHHPASACGFITVSIGIATFDPAIALEAPDVLRLLRSADNALYQAKIAGRNRTVLSGLPIN